MFKVWIDFQDDDRDAVSVVVHAIPRIGEKVGMRQSEAMLGTQDFLLDYVVDVRHFMVPVQIIRVLTSERAPGALDPGIDPRTRR
ncbi:MAG: hypothetical protein ABW167_07585 [Baekduia sp.]